MSSKTICAAFLLIFGLQLPLWGQTKTAASPQAEKKEDPLGRFYWVADSTDTRSLAFGGAMLSTVKMEAVEQNLVDIETEIERQSANSMRITRRVYDRGTLAGRKLVEVVVENVSAGAGGVISATRTVSKLDVNGRMQIARKDSQETVPAGPEEFRTRTSSMVSRGSDALVKVEEIVQIEKKKGEGAFEFSRSRMLADVNGAWTTSEQRTGSVRETTGQVSSQEDVYRQGINGKMTLERRESSREYKDNTGRVVKDVDVYRPDSTGGLQLDSRMNIALAVNPDGSEQTVQSLYQKNAVSPSEGMRLNQVIVKSSRAADSHTTVVDTALQTPDANGRLQTIGQVRTVEKK
jgi:hypothetical protein